MRARPDAVGSDATSLPFPAPAATQPGGGGRVSQLTRVGRVDPMNPPATPPAATIDRTISLPAPRGPLSRYVLDLLLDRSPTERAALTPCPPHPRAVDPIADDDLQLALFLCYELHYTGLPGVPAGMEWHPALIAFRSTLEAAVETSLRELTAGPAPVTAGRTSELVAALVEHDDGPSLSRWMRDHGSLAEMREFVVHRSAYQLKEADPHTWTIPRLTGGAKRLLAEIQSGEYGTDEPHHRMHSELFATTMQELDLDPRPLAYLDLLPASTLATGNLVSMFGLHRRLRAAAVGHLAVFELTSVEPMRRYGEALRRMGASDAAARFYDVHVLADAVHERVALEMVDALVADEPALREDVEFGARAVLEVERRFATHLLDRWSSRRTSLRPSLAA